MATGLGILLGLDVFTGLAACTTWLLVAFAFRISSLAALCAYAASPAYAYWLIDTQHMELAVFLFGLIALRHAENIKRLLTGQESRISFSKKETPPQTHPPMRQRPRPSPRPDSQRPRSEIVSGPSLSPKGDWEDAMPRSIANPTAPDERERLDRLRLIRPRMWGR